ncbi:MAG TPA: alpha-glucosidase [Thermococcus paralvinellae]|uniref:Alpha-glucosidase n=1 Tax=Thermococcus paralvinellae TaxID=582419 RepID=A0A832ZGF8_9EURY|nr:alpha-glucosidase [Thermococcus paralvinellae]HIP89403.1 alpha-glucosidase [Thermococcus paralvinellae]
MKSPGILKETAEVLKQTKERVLKLKSLSEKNKQKVLRLLDEAARNFEELSGDVVIDNVELAEFFHRKAVELKNNTYDKKIERLGEKEYVRDAERINRYSKAAPYDFSGKIKELNKVYKAYLYGLVPFFIISGIFGPAYAITALILVIPALLSLFSMKKRGSLGLMLAYAVIPIPLVMGALTIRYSIWALMNQQEVQRVAEALGKGIGFAQATLVLLLALSVLELTLLGYAAYGLYKHRHAFL